MFHTRPYDSSTIVCFSFLNTSIDESINLAPRTRIPVKMNLKNEMETKSVIATFESCVTILELPDTNAMKRPKTIITESPATTKFDIQANLIIVSVHMA